MSQPRHFLDIDRIPVETLRQLIGRAIEMKRARKAGDAGVKPLVGKTLTMIFDQPSTRTRVSFDVGMQQLGGSTMMLTGTEMQIGRGETIADTARVLSRYVDAIMIRILDHEMLYEMAEASGVPIINGMTKQSHPCQVMADLMTFEERKGPIAGKTVAWSGDTNNVLASWMHAAAQFDFTLKVATPKEFAPREYLSFFPQNTGSKGQFERFREAWHLMGAPITRDRGTSPPCPPRFRETRVEHAAETDGARFPAERDERGRSHLHELPGFAWLGWWAPAPSWGFGEIARRIMASLVAERRSKTWPHGKHHTVRASTGSADVTSGHGNRL